MYEAFFGFTRRPFAPLPQVDQYFPGAAIEAARGTLFRCLQRAEGVGMVVGPSGTGKTLLCQMLAGQFRGSFDIALLTSGRLSTRRALFQAILFELGRPYRGMDEGELRLALVDHLTSPTASAGLVLLVDEAHTLPVRLLEEIRLLTNLSRAGQPCVRLAVAGSSALEERFASPKLDSFSQRVVARCYLEAFRREETQSYIHGQIGAVGGNGPDLFPGETCQSVFQATDGVPRLVNQVCDHALLLAYAGGQRRIEAAHIEEAWADLQQLPTPWNGEAASEAAAGNIIEFGGLDDSPDDTKEPDMAQTPATPNLRISPEPEDQLQRIEQMLANVEEEFQPAGSIGPEVELIFEEFDGPFSEPFEEEEVVVERHAAASPPAAKHASPLPLGEGQGVKGNKSGQSIGSSPHPDPLPEGEGGPRVMPQPVAKREPVAKPEPQPQPAPAEPIVLRRVKSAETKVADDETMIVVEEGYDDTPPPPLRPIIPVRRQEYKQLFAKLRRG